MGFNTYKVTQLSFQCIICLDFPEIIILDWGANDKTLIEFFFHFLLCFALCLLFSCCLNLKHRIVVL